MQAQNLPGSVPQSPVAAQPAAGSSSSPPSRPDPFSFEGVSAAAGLPVAANASSLRVGAPVYIPQCYPSGRIRRIATVHGETMYEVSGLYTAEELSLTRPDAVAIVDAESKLSARRGEVARG